MLHGFRLRTLAIGNVDARACVSEEGAVRFDSRCALIEKPAIFTVMPAQSVFHRKLFSCIKGSRIGIQTASQVFRVNSQSPTVSQLLLERVAAKIQPTPVKK